MTNPDDLTSMWELLKWETQGKESWEIGICYLEDENLIDDMSSFACDFFEDYVSGLQVYLGQHIPAQAS